METGKNNTAAATTTMPSSPSQAAAAAAATSQIDGGYHRGGGDPSHKDVHAARMGLLRAIWQTSVAPRFSSKPIVMDEEMFLFTDGPHQLGSSFVSTSVRTKAGGDCDDDGTGSYSGNNNNDQNATATTGSGISEERFRNLLKESSKLPQSELDYLEGLLKVG